MGSRGIKDIWRQLVNEIDAEIVQGGFWKGPRVQGRVGPWTITLDEYTVHSKPVKIVYTRVRAPFVSRDGFRFKIYDEWLLTSIRKKFGLQDVEIGDPVIDQKFILKSNDEARLRQLLSNTRLRHSLATFSHIDFAVRNGGGWFGKGFPDNVDELYFRTPLPIRDVAGLKTLYEMFAETLQQLHQLGVASDQPPDVKL